MTQSERGNHGEGRNRHKRLQTPKDLPDKAAGLQRQAETAVLGDAIAELAARMQAATYELLVMVGEDLDIQLLRPRVAIDAVADSPDGVPSALLFSVTRRLGPEAEAREKGPGKTGDM